MDGWDGWIWIQLSIYSIVTLDSSTVCRGGDTVQTRPVQFLGCSSMGYVLRYLGSEQVAGCGDMMLIYE